MTPAGFGDIVGFQTEVADLVERLAGIATWVWDPETQRTDWSDNLYRLLGYEPGEVAPSVALFYDSLHPLDRTRVLENASRGADYRPIECRLIRADGDVRHIRTSAGRVVAGPDGESSLVVGVLHDVTPYRRVSRVVAAHTAVSTALAEWEGLETGAEALLRGLGEAMGFHRGVMLVPDGGVLRPAVFWQADPFEPVSDAVRAMRLPRGSGVAGRAWETRAPVNVSNVLDQMPYAFRGLAEQEGVRGAVSIPALSGDEVLAVLGFVSREEMTLPDDLMGSLTGIGHEVGHFLERRGGDLAPPGLSPREVEVLQLGARGLSMAEIAARLGIGRATAKTHFEHAYEKLGVHDRAAAVAEGLRLGVIE